MEDLFCKALSEYKEDTSTPSCDYTMEDFSYRGATEEGLRLEILSVPGTLSVQLELAVTIGDIRAHVRYESRFNRTELLRRVNAKIEKWRPAAVHVIVELEEVGV